MAKRNKDKFKTLIAKLQKQYLLGFFVTNHVAIYNREITRVIYFYTFYANTHTLTSH